MQNAPQTAQNPDQLVGFTSVLERTLFDSSVADLHTR